MLVEACNIDNLLELKNVCIIFLLAFAVFSFRIAEEVLHVKYGDITFYDGNVGINIDVSKTD